MLFKKPHTDSLVLILDIQSSIIRASLVHFQEKTPPHIIYTHTKNILCRPTAGSSKIIHATLEALKEITENVYHFVDMKPYKESLPRKISEVYFVLSSPWVISQAKTLVQTFKQSTEVTERLIFDLIAKERSTLIPENDVKSRHVDIIEEKIFNVRLNGYEVHHWKDKKTRELEISFAVSIAGSNTTRLFCDVCTIVPRTKIYFHSSLLLQHVAIQQLTPSHSAYILVHVHGELTDVAVVNHRSCIFFGSYPIGAYSVARKIAQKTKSDIEVADSAIELYTQKNFDTAHPTRDIEAVEGGGVYWTDGFKEMIASVKTTIGIPSRVLVCGHTHEEFFIQSLKRAYPHIEAEILTTEQLRPFVQFASNLEPVRLTGLYTMAIHSLLFQDMI